MNVLTDTSPARGMPAQGARLPSRAFRHGAPSPGREDHNPQRSGDAPSADELRALLAPYTDPRGGYRCPVCAAPIRVLDPAGIVGCPDARDLERLAASAGARCEDCGEAGRAPALDPATGRVLCFRCFYVAHPQEPA